MKSNIKEIAETPDRLPQKSLDGLFIEYYLETASNAESYRRACKAAGHDFNDKYAAQYGKAMFDRLSTDINKAMEKADTEDEALGRMVQRYIAINGENENTRLSAATALRKKKTERLEIVKHQTIDDIDAELEALEAEMKSKAIEGEYKPVEESDPSVTS